MFGITMMIPRGDTVRAYDRASDADLILEKIRSLVCA